VVQRVRLTNPKQKASNFVPDASDAGVNASTITVQGDAEAFWAYHRLADVLLPPHRFRALLESVGGSPTAAIEPAAWRSPKVGLTEKQQARLSEVCQKPIAPRIVADAERLGVGIIPYNHPLYPTPLTPYDDAPSMLFVQGTLIPEDRFSVAIVGSRRATRYGREQSHRFGQAFAERGLVVISGGAAGVDTAAHQGALYLKGRTIAIVACGLDTTYPSENKKLFAEIVEGGGAIVSEFPIGTTPEPWRFPTRNRIIAGMSRVTVVIETPSKSGALITARQAAEYGKDVWVVPGPVDTGRSQGGHQLIQDGAYLADSPEDVLQALGLEINATSTPLPVATTPALPPNLSPEETTLLQALDLTPLSLDAAAEQCGLPSPAALAAATLLEMKGLIRRQPGNLFVRVL
jgi:DNA processing protein